MLLIIGLGNPENEYSNTRHNMGFDVINRIAQQNNIDITKTKFKGLCGSGNIAGNKVVLLKPQTYMNLSGEAINQYMAFYITNWGSKSEFLHVIHKPGFQVLIVIFDISIFH